METQYWGNPEVAWFESTPAIHVTCLYTSWYMRIVDTHSILNISLFRSSHSLHRIEFGPPKFFSKTFRFPIIFYSTLQIFGGGHFRKAYRSRKKKSKQSEITYKQSEPVKTICKIEKRREFVWALCHQQCQKNSFKRFYIVKELLFLVEKASFSKEFQSEFQCGGESNTIILFLS